MLRNQVTAPDNLILISKSVMMVLIGHLSALHADVWRLLSLASGSQRELTAPFITALVRH